MLGDQDSFFHEERGEETRWPIGTSWPPMLAFELGPGKADSLQVSAGADQ
jgi:hypothetical protein